MRLNRRSMLRAGGLAAGVALAGCTGVFGNSPGQPRDWQYDTAVVSESPNRFFRTVDHARLYEDRGHLPASVRESVETAAYTPLEGEAVESTVTAGVGADPGLLDRYRQASGPLGEVATGLQAGGIGMTVDGATTDVRLAGLYEDAESAAATDAVALVEGAAESGEGGAIGDTDAIETVEATYDGEAVVVTVRGETQSLLEGTAITPPAGPAG